MDFNIADIIEKEWLLKLVYTTLIVSFGFVLIRTLSRFLGKVVTQKKSEHAGLMTQKFIFYLGSALLFVTFLSQLGFKFTAILGAAGIATFAIGFAAQTSLSNLISGIFLYWEKPFETGDLVRIEGQLGVILSIDLISVKMKTLDNLFVRIPNETVIKTQVTNVTRFPIRRMDIIIGVAYKEDFDHVMKMLRKVADENAYTLKEPSPLLIFDNFGSSSLDFKLGVWFEKSQYVEVRNSIMKEIKECFDKEGIEIPFPHLSLYSGSVTQPIPISITDHQAFSHNSSS